MFINIRKFSIWIVVLVAIFTILAGLLLLKPENGPVLAQGGGDSDEGSSLLETIQDSDLGEAVVVPAGGDIGSQSDDSGIEVVPIGAFRHDGDNAAGFVHDLPGGYIYNESASLMCFSAPAYLPEGATVTELHWTFLDDSAAEDLAMFLFRVQNTNTASNGSQLMVGATVSPWDNPGVFEAVYNGAISNPVISHDYSYYLYFCFQASTGLEMRLYGARVFYTP